MNMEFRAHGGRSDRPRPRSGPRSEGGSDIWPWVWPFDAQTAKRRQNTTASACDVPVQEDVSLPAKGTLETVLIPPGEFLMGDAGERRRVERPFYMGRYPVTQAQYEAVMGKNPSCFKGPNRPVEEVSWEDAQAFCEKLSAKLNRKFRLPSEAEWEYACRAGTTTRYYSGDGLDDLARAGWFEGNSGGETHPVGEKEPNAFGLYDMHGNVWEWCAGADSLGRVCRGGSWSIAPGNCRSAYRLRGIPVIRISSLGFRVSLDF